MHADDHDRAEQDKPPVMNAERDKDGNWTLHIMQPKKLVKSRDVRKLNMKRVKGKVNTGRDPGSGRNSGQNSARGTRSRRKKPTSSQDTSAVAPNHGASDSSTTELKERRRRRPRKGSESHETDDGARRAKGALDHDLQSDVDNEEQPLEDVATGEEKAEADQAENAQSEDVSSVNGLSERRHESMSESAAQADVSGDDRTREHRSVRHSRTKSSHRERSLRRRRSSKDVKKTDSMTRSSSKRAMKELKSREERIRELKEKVNSLVAQCNQKDTCLKRDQDEINMLRSEVNRLKDKVASMEDTQLFVEEQNRTLAGDVKSLKQDSQSKWSAEVAREALMRRRAEDEMEELRAKLSAEKDRVSGGEWYIWRWLHCEG